jgi:hypothetical protein
MTESISGAQLLVEGPQDVWLTSEPQMSFFRSSYKRHVPFGMSLERVNVNPGGLVRFDTSKGDLLGYVYMTKHDPVTDAHVPTPITFTSMATRLGEQILDKRDLMYLNTIRRVLESRNESQAKTPPGFQPLFLPFTGSYFPLVAIRHAQLDLVFEGLDGAYTYKVWGEFIHLSYEERSWFELSTHKLMIQQVRKTVPLNGDLCLSGPIKYIAWPTFNYTGEYISDRPPVLITPAVPVIINTGNANTFVVTQTTPYYNLITLVYTTSLLPVGMSVSTTSQTGITFSFAQGTNIDVQSVSVSVKNPIEIETRVEFPIVAAPVIDRYLLENYQDQSYTVNGGANPTFYAARGTVIVFYLNAPGQPFNIQTVSGAYSAVNVYTNGVTYPGIDVGTIVWRVPSNAPSTLYYASTYNSLMVGTINVFNN